MKRKISTAESGYALILMVLGLMGVGGIVLAGFTQGVKVQSEHERYLHNQRVLREAKQALLQYAYNYPVTEGNGPGRLPCPDTDSSGTPNPVPGCDAAAGVVGRFPWKTPELNFYDVKDASGEELWYAVSNNFGNSGTITINSSTSGSVTLQDRSGAVLHDGTDNTPASGIAAVIIAPGSQITRGGVLQDRAADEDDPVHYLDLFGAIDNADFINDDLNGFVTGPIRDVVTGDLLVNDQMIVITAAEVIAVAEKATLQAYRHAINDYLVQTGGIYPWLFNYDDVDTVDKLSEFYPADADFTVNPNYHDNYGRIPAMFGEYFVRANSEEIENEVLVTLTNDYAAMPGAVGISPGVDQNFFSGALPNNVHELDLVSDFLPVAFSDQGTNPNARLVVTLPAEDTVTQHLYFWDGHGGSATGFWKICPDDGNGESNPEDCYRDTFGNPDPGGVNDNNEEILHIQVDITMGEAVNGGEVAFDADYLNLPGPVTVSYPAATNLSHALITVDNIAYGDLDLLPARAPTITATYEIDRNNLVGEAFQIQEFGDVVEADLFAGATLKVEMRYFPEVPGWAHKDNDDWHNSIMMAYADDYRPDQNGAAGDCAANPPCLQINGLGGVNNDKIAVLVLAGERSWADGDISPPVLADGAFADELGDVFNLENSNLDSIFDIRTIEATDAPGDKQLDKILVVN